MSLIHRLPVIICSLLLTLLAAPFAVSAQPTLTPIDLPCATNASVQVLGRTLVNDDSQALVQVRVILGPGGKVDLHLHPGTLVLTAEQGEFGYSHMGEGELILNRVATANTEATQEPLTHGELVVINPGDWLVETGMVHISENLGPGEATVLLAGLVAPDQPLIQCVEEAVAAPRYPDRRLP